MWTNSLGGCVDTWVGECSDYKKMRNAAWNEAKWRGRTGHLLLSGPTCSSGGKQCVAFTHICILRAVNDHRTFPRWKFGETELTRWPGFKVLKVFLVTQLLSGFVFQISPQSFRVNIIFHNLRVFAGTSLQVLFMLLFPSTVSPSLVWTRQQ